jgi:hypothetical protein
MPSMRRAIPALVICLGAGSAYGREEPVVEAAVHARCELKVSVAPVGSAQEARPRGGSFAVRCKYVASVTSAAKPSQPHQRAREGALPAFRPAVQLVAATGPADGMVAEVAF